MTTARNTTTLRRAALPAAGGVVLLALLMGCGAVEPTEVAASPSTSAPSVSAPPTPTPTPTPTGATADPPEGEPERVVVTALGGDTLVDAPMKPEGLDAEGILAPPPGIVGWYDETGWPLPGHPGASILAGHINTRKLGDDTFARLPDARAGAKVTVTYDSGDVATFVVTRSEAVPKSQTPKDDSIWDAGNPEPLLRLITCDPTTPVTGGHYVGNWVVWASALA